jgi:hypothetical protein
LLVLDGLMPIENAREKGQLILIHRHERGQEIVLNDPQEEELSQLFKAR